VKGPNSNSSGSASAASSANGGNPGKAGKAPLILIAALALASIYVGQVYAYEPLVRLALVPVQFLATNLHELGHALFCVLTGGTVHGLTIVSDGDGHAGLTFGSGGIPFIYDQTGYLGTTMFGCLLLFFGRYRKNARAVLMALGVFVALASIVFMAQTFEMSGQAGFNQAAIYSIGLALAMGGGLFLIGLKSPAALAHYLLLFLAVQIALAALNDVIWLVQISAGMAGAQSFSDATNMAELTGVPAVVWSIWWGVASLAMLFFTLRLAYRKA
jgi:hypothetical protein